MRFGSSLPVSPFSFKSDKEFFNMSRNKSGQEKAPGETLCRKEFIVVSVNVDVETYLSMRAPRVCLSVHEGVCVGMCLCARAVMGVGRGQAAPCQGQGMEWVMEGSCKSVPRGNNQCLEEGGPCANLLVVYFPSPSLFLFISNWAQ